MKSVSQPSDSCDKYDVGLVGSKDVTEGPGISKEPTLVKQQGICSLSSLSSTNTVRRWVKRRKTYKLWFGRLHIANSTYQHWESRFISGNIQRTELLELDVTLVPATWLLRNGAVLNIKRAMSQFSAPGLQFSLRPLSVIAWDNPIRQSFRRGRLVDVQKTLAEGNAHLSSVFPDGSSLVLQCLHDLWDGLFPKGILPEDIVNFLDNYLDFEVEPLSSETTATLSNMIRIAMWLAKQGNEIDTYNSEAV